MYDFKEWVKEKQCEISMAMPINKESTLLVTELILCSLCLAMEFLASENMTLKRPEKSRLLCSPMS
jgi:hypothetical protein